ncbi:YcxB family protein [Aurantiacibacter xanthus]|uniref:YcxB family protein n=1 Tax=Aurantiacibacter xanthus TaxID=1784712 RepID=A0A3A1PDK8_9SPHN|nr:YcxB family protein [Aurantiacibacter xanthus]RIV91896.1 YcxB family protein [Aurantiacibacter xanthus]
MTELRGELQLAEGDYLAFQRLYIRRMLPRLGAFAGVVLLVIAGFWLAGNISAEVVLGAGLGAILMVVAIWAVSHFVTIPWQVRRIYRESAALRERVEIVCDKEAVRFVQASGNWRLKWAEVARWDETDAIFCLFPNRAMAHLLPKRDLPPELIDYIRARLISSGLSKPWKLRK